MVDCVVDGETALDGIDLCNYDLAIVDLGLPGMSGQDLIRRMRARGLALPVMILTAEDRLSTRVEGLNVDADGLHNEAFRNRRARSAPQALLRRSHLSMAQELRFGPLAYNLANRNFSIDGAPLAVSQREHALLEILVRHGGATISKEILLEAMYGMDEEVSPATIEVNIHRLRKKLENTSVSIETVRGLGYLLRLAKNS